MSFSGKPFMMPPPIISNSLPMSIPPPQSTYRASPTINQRPQIYKPPAELAQGPPKFEGPIITVFVGNISEKVPENMIKKILSTVGAVVSWKRVSTFGFCEYDKPTTGLRAVRILHNLDVGGKKLIAKVDAKNKLFLDNYKEEENMKLGIFGRSNDEMEMKDDNLVLKTIAQILDDFKFEIDNFAEHLSKATKALEGGKFDLISREIERFRKAAQEDEQNKEKEKDRRKREENDRDKTVDFKKDEDRKSRRRSRSRSRKRERERDRNRELERERERDRDRKRERERERERDRERERHRDRDEKVVKMSRDKEVEEENRERKKAWKKALEKETAYQERLRNWETRERRKAKDYEKEKENKLEKEQKREKEARHLKEFLQNYIDDRDDPIYYKDRELQRRIAERSREANQDAKDRNKEQKELDDLKVKIFSGDFENPTQVFERHKKERDNLYRPKILIDVNSEQSQQREKELELERGRQSKRQKFKERERLQKERYVVAQTSRELAAVDSESNNDANFNGGGGGGKDMAYRDSNANRFPTARASMQYSPTLMSSKNHISNRHPSTLSISQQLITMHLGGANAKKKKLGVRDVFNIDDDSEDVNGPIKMKLVPLDNDESEANKLKTASVAGTKLQSSIRKDKIVEDYRKDEAARIQEEKRRRIKSIIDKMPTAKSDVFNYKLDWNEIDNRLMEKKMRPWINKKIIEYIGEPEPTLVDFICSKVLAGSTPQSILDDVQMVLDDEAELFVVKMWRLLIYEVETKKIGLGNK